MLGHDSSSHPVPAAAADATAAAAPEGDEGAAAASTDPCFGGGTCMEVTDRAVAHTRRLL
jgi:hypothetical protein